MCGVVVDISPADPSAMSRLTNIDLASPNSGADAHLKPVSQEPVGIAPLGLDVLDLGNGRGFDGLGPSLIPTDGRG